MSGYIRICHVTYVLAMLVQVMSRYDRLEYVSTGYASLGIIRPG
jgi:hypothetical protein